MKKNLIITLFAINIITIQASELTLSSDGFELEQRRTVQCYTPPLKPYGGRFPHELPLSRSCEHIPYYSKPAAFDYNANLEDVLAVLATSFHSLVQLPFTHNIHIPQKNCLEKTYKQTIQHTLQCYNFTQEAMDRALELLIKKQNGAIDQPTLSKVYYWMIRILLKSKANPNGSSFNERPLHYAEHSQTVKALLDHGAEIVDYSRLTQTTKNICLFYVIDKQNKDPDNAQIFFALANALISHGADFTADSSDFQGLWFNGLLRILSDADPGHSLSLEKMLSACVTGSDIRSLSQISRDALLFYFIARQNNEPSDVILDQIRTLLAFVDPNTPNPFFPKSWLRALHCTIDVNVVDLLVKSGAKTTACSLLDNTQYQWPLAYHIHMSKNTSPGRNRALQRRCDVINYLTRAHQENNAHNYSYVHAS
ncbi:MAG: hypothetical protein H6679_02330 [Epsilonproteobacteria bacterium]|nr:hypothetical protein [Campylobacterota bacterium]